MTRRTARPGRVRRRLGVAALVLVLVAAGAYFPATLLAPVAPASATIATITPPSTTPLALSFPSYGATAVEAVGFPDSLQSSGDTQPRAIASISKIIMALVVLDKRPLNGGAGPKVAFTATDRKLYAAYLALDGEVAAMPTDVTLTERQVLQVALIKSANNYAGTLANWAFGNQRAYAVAATAWLKSHGLDHTTIVEPTGLSPSNRSTATDLVKLGKLALANADIATIVDTKTAEIPGVGTVHNSNQLLGIDDVVGIKTGTLDQAGACLLFATKQKVQGTTVTVIGVMLGGATHAALDVDIRKLLATVTAGFQTVHAVTKGDAFGTYATPWGATARAVAAASVSKLVYGPVAVSTKVSTEKLSGSVAGAKVGSVTVTVGSTTTTVPLVLDGALGGPDAWWRITNPDKVF